jgi:hypothetical protein
VYVREIDGEETTFGVSGALWRDALIFYDRGTESYWSQIDGRSVNGEHKGKRLTKYPSLQTTWGEWKKLHPETLVLKPSKRSREGSHYSGYFKSADKMGVMGTENPDDRLAGKSLVLGVESEGKFVAIPLGLLQERGVLDIELDGQPLLLVSAFGEDGYAYRPVAGDQRLHFRQQDGKLFDTETGSEWDAASGSAVSGDLAGTQLERVDARKIFWFVWARFHPETALVNP